MCKYCQVDEKGDMIYEEIVKPKKGLSASAGVEADEKKLCIEITYNRTSDPYYATTLVTNGQKINFCPMCGRKL